MRTGNLQVTHQHTDSYPEASEGVYYQGIHMLQALVARISCARIALAVILIKSRRFRGIGGGPLSCFHDKWTHFGQIIDVHSMI